MSLRGQCIMGLSRLWLLCIVFCDAPVTTALDVHTWSERSKESVLCSWSYENLTVSRRAFCRGDCEQDMLVQTSDLGPQTHGRYSLKHQIQGSPPEDTITVTISNLTTNDSGRYGCLWEGLNQTNYQEFKVEVTDGNKMQNFPTSPTATPSPFYDPHSTHYYNSYYTHYYNSYYTHYYYYDSYYFHPPKLEIEQQIDTKIILNYCGTPHSHTVWLGLQIFILITALPANSALLWLVFKSRHNLSPPQLLALNISIMGIVYCLLLPLELYDTLCETSEAFHHLSKSISALNMLGCPLFLTLMCLERFVAAAFPITYIQLGKTKPRVVLSAVTWAATVSVAFLLYFNETMVTILCLAAVISAFFLIMLICLVGLVWVLRQSGPGEGANSSSDSLKKRALVNIIIVIVPSVIAYSPLVAIICYLSVIFTTDDKAYTTDRCTVLMFLWSFPNFGFYIGPLFYVSTLRQITCCKSEKAVRTQTQDV